MSTPANTFDAGIKAAIEHLRGTAEDFEQMAERLGKIKIPNTSELRNLTSLREKAQLLRGQIMALGHLEH